MPAFACVAALVANKRANDLRELASLEAHRAERNAREAHQAEKVAVEAQRQALLERDHSRQLSADLALDKGIALAQEGHADRGLLWMLEASKTAPDDAEGFRKMVRWNLGAWLGQVHKTAQDHRYGRSVQSPRLQP